MIAPAQTDEELNWDKPTSPQEFGRWVFHNQKPLQRLTAMEDVKP